MKRAETISFTYEEVRQALEQKFGVKLEGIRVARDIGFLATSCPKEQQTHEPDKETEN